MDNMQLIYTAALVAVSLVSVISSAIVAARSGISITSALDTAFERVENLLEKKTVQDAVEYEYLKSTGAKRNAIDFALDVAAAVSRMTKSESDDFIQHFTSAIRDGKPNTDAVTPVDDTPVVEPVEDAPEPTFIAETLTYNSELEGALDGTVDTGTDFRYQRRPPGWMVHWIADPDHQTPPFINDVADGFRAELAFIAGEIGYRTSGVLNVKQGTYLVKAVLDANIPNPPENKNDIVVSAALYREDGTIHQTLPEQPLAGWHTETTYLIPLKVGKGGLFSLAVYAKLRYPTVGAEGSVTFKEIRLETDDGNAGDYVAVG